MNPRYRLAGMVTLAFVALCVLGMMIRGGIYKPVKALDAQIAQLGQKLQSLNKDRAAFFAAQGTLAEYGKRTFADSVDRANARAGAMLNDLIMRVGLNEREFTRIPSGAVRLAGAKETGWSVQGEGPLEKVVDLIFLLDQVPVLHRIQNLALSAGDKPGRVRVRFRYLTLVLDSAPSETAANLVPALSLDAPPRKVYQAVVERDFFRPYIKREHGSEMAPAPSPPVAGAANPWQAMKVVSLSEWQGKAEIHIRDQHSQQTRVFHPGDSLMEATIVAVDYRPLPKPGSPGLLSYSRVILRSGDQFWAIERGQMVADRYALNSDQLPPEFNRHLP